MTKPNVVHVYKDYYPPVIGGIENTINIMARGTRDEFDVTVLVCAGSEKPGEEWISGVRVIRVPEWGRMASAPISWRFPAVLRETAASADILHFHHPNPTGDVSYFLARPKAPVVMTYHSDVVRQKYAMWMYGRVQQRMMAACRVIMPTSPQYIESSRWLGRFREKCRVVPLGIDLRKYRCTQAVRAKADEIRNRLAGPIVLFVGKLRYYKGLPYLIEAMEQLEATLVIIGGGPEFSRIREIAEIHKVTPRAQFLGELPDAEVLPYLYAADVFCLPSHQRSEAFGLSQVEAMACGLPVVCTEIGTGTSFVNQHMVTGVVVPPADPDTLAGAIRLITSNPELRQQMSAAAKSRVEQMFSAESMCTELKKVYRSVLG